MDFDRMLAEASTLHFSGWDFSLVENRWRTERPPWNYTEILRERLRVSSALLDLGTGGGELLESLAPLPRTVYATEGYPPNLEVAAKRLKPLGVHVLPIGSDNRIPLADKAVDLVANRHEEFSGTEIYRVLMPDGWFVTQQVGSHDHRELGERFGVAPAPPTNDVSSAEALADEVSRSGMFVQERQEASFSEEFLDVGALVYFLRAAPWEVPGFSIARMRGELRDIHQEIVRSGSFRVTAHRILVLARRLDQ